MISANNSTAMSARSRSRFSDTRKLVIICPSTPSVFYGRRPPLRDRDLALQAKIGCIRGREVVRQRYDLHEHLRTAPDVEPARFVIVVVEDEAVPLCGRRGRVPARDRHPALI